MKKLIPLLALVILAGCNVQKYQVKQLDKYSILQHSEFLRLSDLLNPCFQGKAKSDTTIIFGKADTTYTKGDTVTVLRHDTVIVTIKLPGRNIDRPGKTVTIHDTIPDTRRINTLTDQLGAANNAKLTLTTQLTDKSATARTRLYWMIGLIALIVIYIAIKIYIFFSGGAVAGTLKKFI